MSYFYADGNDKNGNRLMTSYGKRQQAEKYRAGAKFSQGEKFLNIQENGNAKIGDEGELLVRTLMIRANAEQEDMTGKFVVYAKVNGQWQETDFRYKTYAAANSAVKTALINLYPACAVIEEDESGPKRDEVTPVTTDDEAPF